MSEQKSQHEELVKALQTILAAADGSAGSDYYKGEAGEALKRCADTARDALSKAGAQ